MSAFVDYCCELLAPAGATHARRMFGGWCIYLDGLFLAIATGETLYLKADESTRVKFEAAGGTRFSYAVQGKQQALNFWTVPAEAMDSARHMQPWSVLALRAANRATPPTRSRR